MLMDNCPFQTNFDTKKNNIDAQTKNIKAHLPAFPYL